MIQGGGVAINKAKIEHVDFKIDSSALINNKYILVQKGKKNYYVIKVI
jgi:tyrosyl-tRNA synthetase